MNLNRLIYAIAVLLFAAIITGISIGNSLPEKTIEEPEVIIQDTVPAFFSQSPEEGLKEALDYYEIHHSDIVYAQAILETGNFKSQLCIKHNNLFGLYDSRNKRYHRFPHWQESVRAYKNWIQYRYRNGEDYYKFLKRIKYATDPNYINKVKTIVSNEQRISTEGAPGAP